MENVPGLFPIGQVKVTVSCLTENHLVQENQPQALCFALIWFVTEVMHTIIIVVYMYLLFLSNVDCSGKHFDIFCIVCFVLAYYRNRNILMMLT